MYKNLPLFRFPRSFGIRAKITVGIIVFLLALALPALLSSGGDLLSRILPGEQRPVGPQSSGPSVPWSKMLARANQEAAKIDKNVIQSGVNASPPGVSDDRTYAYIGYTGPMTGSLLLTFFYDQPNGGSFFIEMEDAEPENTTYVDTRFVRLPTIGASSFISESGMISNDILKDELSKSRISPREAVAATWNEALKEAQKSGLKGFSLEPQIIFLPNTNSWDVSYDLMPIGVPGQDNQKTTAIPTTKPLNHDGLIYFSVDPASGQINQ